MGALFFLLSLAAGARSEQSVLEKACVFILHEVHTKYMRALAQKETKKRVFIFLVFKTTDDGRFCLNILYEYNIIYRSNLYIYLFFLRYILQHDTEAQDILLNHFSSSPLAVETLKPFRNCKPGNQRRNPPHRRDGTLCTYAVNSP